MKRNRNISQILGTIGDKILCHKNLYVYEDGILKHGCESLTKFFSKPSYVRYCVKEAGTRFESCRKVYCFSYIFEVPQAQAVVSRSTMCTSKIFCYVESNQDKKHTFMTKGNSNVKGKPYFYPISRVY